MGRACVYGHILWERKMQLVDDDLLRKQSTGVRVVFLWFLWEKETSVLSASITLALALPSRTPRTSV